jgi:hypothetical protein
MRSRKKFSRRDFLQLTAITAGMGFLAYMDRQRNEADMPLVEWVKVPISGLPSALEGLRIVQISDIHLYPFTSIQLIKQAALAINVLQPDLLVLTGDYLWQRLEVIDALTQAVAQVNPRYGIFASMGNHDYALGGDYVKHSFARNHIRMLVNQNVPITHNGKTFYLAGVDDGFAGQPNWRETVAGVPYSAPVVLLAHEPDLVNAFCGDPRLKLQLSGHTHGGQVRMFGLEMLIRPPLGQFYDIGLQRVRDTWLYTNRGLGTIAVPYRINCPPEITELTLTAA